ncbi:MAG TPA: glycosyltransferase, partial [bacterium]|nr:glycosyltransferase [bacterium]
IIVLLDSDDEYMPDYLEKVDKMFQENPEYKLFNFGCFFEHSDEGGKRLKRGPFIPKEREIGHEVFGGGNIVNGTFAFHRSVYEDLGAYPSALIKDIDCSEINYGKVRDLHMNTPYDFSAYAQLEYPEIRQFFMVDHEAEPNKIVKELGNPWGNDYYLFYKYTRKYHSKPVDENLYVVHIR